jgi:hypothetical protein
LNHAKGLCPFKEKNENPAWHEPYLESIQKIGEGKWRIKVVRAYDD